MKWLVALCWLLASVAFAVAEPVPGWVDRLDLPQSPEAPEEFTDDGVRYLLMDRQVRLGDGVEEHYQRRVVEIASRSGLEQEGAIRLDYDPAEETLVIHDVWRVRDGVRSRVAGLEFLEIRRETSMDYGILDGRLTRYADVPDLRVGDVLDISTTRRGAHSVFADHFIQWVTAWPVSGFQLDRFRLVSRDDVAIVVSGPARPAITQSGGWTERVWLHEDTASAYPEHYWQDWDAFYGYTQIATASTWAEIVQRVDSDYAPRPLPPELQATVRGFEGSTAERVSAAFRFVQDEIRYMGIEIGAGGYIPRPPALVWSRRFGDCKDKALLLVSMLAEMGIAADVVLVNSTEGESLARRTPSPFLFDHAIVRVLGDGTPYFLDPTDALQGGVGARVAVADFVWALPVSEGSDRLVPVPETRPDAPTYEVLSQYRFQSEGAYAAELTVTTTYRGEDADYQRRRFDRDGTGDRAESHFDWYAERYPGAEVLTPLRLTDDLDANVLVIHEHFGITDEGLEDRRDSFWMNPFAVAGELEELPEEAFDTPYPLDPLHARHRVELIGHGGLAPPPDFLMQNAFFRYSRTGYEVPGGIGGDFRVEVLAEEVRPEEADAYRALVEKQDQNDDRRYRLTHSDRVMNAPILMGLSVRSVLFWGVMLAVFGFATLAGVTGYRRERRDLGY